MIAITGGSGFVGSHVVDALLARRARGARHRPEAPAAAATSNGPTSTCSTRTRDRRAQGRRARVPPGGDGRRQRHRSPTRPRASRSTRSGAATRARGGAPRRRGPRRSCRAPCGSTPRRTATRSTRTRCSTSTTDRHLYVSTKIAAEMFCRDYANLFGRPYTVLRYGIPFGPRMRSDLVVAAFLVRAMRGEPLRIDGDGSQERTFVYVEDLAAAHVLALKPVAENRTYNLEAERDRSRSGELAETVRRTGRRRRGHVRSVAARATTARAGSSSDAGAHASSGGTPRWSLRRRPAHDARLVPGAESDARPQARSTRAPAASRSSRRTTRSRRSRPCSTSCTRSSTSSSSSTTVPPTHARRDRAVDARATIACRLLVARRQPGHVGGVLPRAHRCCATACSAASSTPTTSCSPSTPTASTTSPCSTSSSRMTLDEGLDAMLARRDLSYHGPYKQAGNWRAQRVGEPVGRRAAARRRVGIPHLPARRARARARLLLGLQVQRDGRGRGRAVPARLPRPQRPRRSRPGRSGRARGCATP